MVTPKSFVPQFGKTIYISEVNEARKVKSDVQVAMNKNSTDPVRKCFLMSGWGNSAPTQILSKLVELFETSRARKLIFGPQVNIDKANSRRL